MKKQHATKSYYSIVSHGTPMTITVEYDVWIDDSDYLDPVVIFRSREYPDARGFDHGQAAVALKDMVSGRHSGATFVRSEKL